MSTETYDERWLTGPSNTQFYTRTYKPPTNTPTKAVIVFVHGFAEHIGRYLHFHPVLAANGIAVFAYDQRGFGLTAQDTEGKKSKSSAYGKTCWKDQMADIDWAIKEASKTFEGVPVFLMGHSMGGAESLGFACQGEKGAHKETLKSISGVIATSPLIQQTKPASKLMLWIGGKVSLLAPHSLIPAPVGDNCLSHDPEVHAAYIKDPLIRQEGSLRHLGDMLSKGEALLQTHHRDWPKDLPVLIIHGTDDQVTSPKASTAFHEKIAAEKKKLSLYEGGFHELQNESAEVQEKLANEVISFINEHLPVVSNSVPPKEELPADAKAEAPQLAKVEPTELGQTVESSGESAAKAKM